MFESKLSNVPSPFESNQHCATTWKRPVPARHSPNTTASPPRGIVATLLSVPPTAFPAPS
ncbi:MAG: hypothetical protein E6K10_04275 [Methanobacteriota archaeon]|nr:MAG: hypothetical protein E6K10_04275 [Euryarchaeota archaeon]